jgi:hypothetical protein
LRGETPITSKGSTDTVDVGTLSGLTAGSTAHAEASWLHWPALLDSVAAANAAICDSQFPTLVPGYSFAAATTLANIATPCVSTIFTAASLDNIVQRLKLKRQQCRDPKQHLSPADVVICGQLAALKDPEIDADKATDANLAAIRARFSAIQQQAPFLGLLTLGSTVNRQNVSYFQKSDLSTLIKGQTTGYGVNLVASMLYHSALYSGGAFYERSYTDATTVQLCTPVTGTSALKCPQGAIGAPTRQIARLLFTESRFYVLPGKLALSPRIEYDVATSKLAVRLPIYLAPSTTKTLIGGLVIGYTTHGTGLAASVFIGKAFSFL